MDEPSFEQSMTLLSDRDASWRAIWNVYYTVSAALVTLVSTLKVQPPYQRGFVFLMAVGFVIFAAGNFVNLLQISEQRENLARFAISRSNNDALVRTAKALAPRNRVGFYVYHWLLTVFVVALLAFIVIARVYSTKS